MIPIAASPELRMHLRYQSYQGLVFDQILMAELPCHCNQQIGPRALAKHYSEQHSDLMQYSIQYRERIRWTANFGSGKGTCPLCRTQSQKVESHACDILFQLSIMLGQIMHPEHFAFMPIDHGVLHFLSMPISIILI